MENTKEVDELKKFLFLAVGMLLLLGLILPGCSGEGEGEGETPTIYVAVCGQQDDIQGENQMNGAETAMNEINAMNGGDGIEIGGDYYQVELVPVETNESTEGESGSTGTTNLEDVIDDVDFCVGGFRTEVVQVYREVAMTHQKIFMDCGAATGSLQYSVNVDYDNYKYWFKATPYNESFLVKSCFKMLAGVGGYLGATLDGYGTAIDPLYDNPVGGKLRVEILMEDAEWCEAMVTFSELFLPAIGFNVTGTTLVSPTSSDISSELSAIAGRYPHIIFTAFSGSVGAVYSSNKVDLGIPAMTIGINVPGQLHEHWLETGGDCQGEVMLDTWAEDVAITDTTVDWFDAYFNQYGDYPLYTAGTYDAIKAVCQAMHETGSKDTDGLIEWLEDPDNAITGVGGTTAYYQMPADTVCADCGVGGTPIFALNETQVKVYYPNIDDPWIRVGLGGPEVVLDGYHQSDWEAGFVDAGGGLVLQQPHMAHDTVYGPGYQTGIGSQWQDGHKVGIWPIDFGVTSPTFKLTDQYGDWNFQYDGTVAPLIDVTGFLA
jgi:branched-chain amino acid transport system substrate-binding protein